MKRVMLVLTIIVVCLGIWLFIRAGTTEERQQVGMFCWEEEAIEDPLEMEGLIGRLGITRWYQELPQEIDSDETAKFVRSMEKMGVTVEALVGSVEWGFEEDGASLIRYLKDIDAYNRAVKSSRRINGVMADIEPYITEEWKQDRQHYMEKYVGGMKAAYKFAEEKGIRLIACIPRHYDDQGLREGLKELISNACDEVAVMNYGRGDEIQMIETEEALCAEYGKPLHCILEFQDVGVHGLTERETYREQGIGEAVNTWEKLNAHYPQSTIIWDYHWTKPLLKMLEEEGGD